MGSRTGNHREVLRHLKPSRRRALGLLAFVLAATGFPLIGPQLTRSIVDGAVAGEPSDGLVVLAGLYLLVTVLGQVARVLTAWLASHLAWDATNILRERLTEHALTLDLTEHGRRTPGEMIERVDGDVVAIADFVVAFLMDVVASLLLLVGVLVLVLATDWRIGLVLSAYFALVAYPLLRVQRRAVPAARAYRATSGRLFGQLEERFAALDDIRANGAGQHVVARFQEVSRELRDADRRAESITGGLYATSNLALASATPVALVAVVLFYDSVPLGTAVLLLQYTQMVRHPLESIVFRLEEYQKALAGVARVAGFLDLRPTLTPPSGGGRQLRESGPLSLELDRVDFSYGGDELVLRQVDLRLEPGRRLGLVGRTGSGKTTIARLLLRLADPTAGTVRLDGVDLRQVAPRHLRERTVFVTQDVQIFTASVRQNLTLFREDVEDRRLLAALDELDMTGWLSGLPAGLDTVVSGSTGGSDAQIGLSAGEAQRLALARAFLTDPGLVVLDEASSRLDPATETVVEAAVERLLQGRTALLIAHRLSSLARVDEIMVLADGEVVEHGERRQLENDPASHYAGLLAASGAV